MTDTMRRYLKNPRVLAGAALVIVLLAVALWPQAISADLAVVERGPLRVTIDEEGETRVRDRFVVSAPVAGRVLRIELEPGDHVARGDVVATFLAAEPLLLDARARAEARAGVEAAEAAVGRVRAERERAQSGLALARSDLARHQELARQKIVAPSVLEAKEAESRAAEEAARAAEFALAAAVHEREMAGARLSPPSRSGAPITITAPVDGMVLRRQRESEAVVAAGEPLLDIGDAADLEIVSDLLSTDAVKARKGNPVLVEGWGGEQPLRAKVRLVEPSGFMKISALGVEEQRVNVIMDFEDPAAAAQALGDGYRVEVRIVIWETADVVKVPTTALFRSGSEWAAFVVEGGRARKRTVAIGRRNGLETQVLSGLEPGARVIVHPSDRVQDGVRVEATS